MKENYSAEDKSNIKGTVREFELDSQSLVGNEDTTGALANLLQSPWKLITQGKKFGIGGIKRLAGIVILFSVVNIILFLFAIGRLVITGYGNTKLSFVLLMGVLGLAITFYAGYKAYQFVLVNALQAIYKNFTPFIQKICRLAIDNVEKIIKKDKNTSDSQLAKAIDFGKLVNEYYKGMPSLIKTRIVKLLNKVPVTAMVSDIHGDIINGDKEEAGIKLYSKLDDFVTHSVFTKNNTKWVYWLLPLNIIIQVVIIMFKIGN